MSDMMQANWALDNYRPQAQGVVEQALAPPAALGASANGVGLGGKQPNFLQKLYEFLSIEPHPCPDIIYWANDSKQLVIAQPDRLVKEVLPKLFKHDKLSSFGRQLNIYGFSRLFPGRQFKDAEGNISDASVWAHPTLNRLSTYAELSTIKRRAAPKLFRTRRLANGQVVRTRAGPAVEAKFREVRNSIAESRRARSQGMLYPPLGQSGTMIAGAQLGSSGPSDMSPMGHHAGYNEYSESAGNGDETSFWGRRVSDQSARSSFASIGSSDSAGEYHDLPHHHSSSSNTSVNPYQAPVYLHRPTLGNIHEGVELQHSWSFQPGYDIPPLAHPILSPDTASTMNSSSHAPWHNNSSVQYDPQAQGISPTDGFFRSVQGELPPTPWTAAPPSNPSFPTQQSAQGQGQIYTDTHESGGYQDAQQMGPSDWQQSNSLPFPDQNDQTQNHNHPNQDHPRPILAPLDTRAFQSCPASIHASPVQRSLPPFQYDPSQNNASLNSGQPLELQPSFQVYNSVSPTDAYHNPPTSSLTSPQIDPSGSYNDQTTHPFFQPNSSDSSNAITAMPFGGPDSTYPQGSKISPPEASHIAKPAAANPLLHLRTDLKDDFDQEQRQLCDQDQNSLIIGSAQSPIYPQWFDTRQGTVQGHNEATVAKQEQQDSHYWQTRQESIEIDNQQKQNHGSLPDQQRDRFFRPEPIIVPSLPQLQLEPAPQKSSPIKINTSWDNSQSCGTIDPKWVSPRGSEWSSPIATPIGGMSPLSLKSQPSTRDTSKSSGSQRNTAEQEDGHDQEMDIGEQVHAVDREDEPKLLPQRYAGPLGLSLPTLSTMHSSLLSGNVDCGEFQGQGM